MSSQALPFQRSASNLETLTLSVDQPTLVQTSNTGQSIATSTLLYAFSGLGTDSMTHDVPSQRSARGADVAPVTIEPTAVQSEGEIHATAFNLTPAVSGADSSDQPAPFQLSTSG